MSESNNSLGEIYKIHHKERRRPFFVLQGEVRGNFLKERISSGKKVLDIGCRDGALTEYYAKGNDVIGVDIDKEALNRAKNKLGIETMSFDLNGDWPFNEGTFDFIVAAEVIEHIYYPDIVFSKINKLLKPGGTLLGSLPNAFSLMNRFRYLFGTKKGTPLQDPTHINHFSRKELEALLKANFSSFKIYPLGKYAFLERLFPGLFSFMMMFEAKK